jgi:FxsC-like protein
MAGASEMNSSSEPGPPLGVFTIEIATPGGSSADWRPFSDLELPLAEYARQVVERFDLKAEVIELAADRDRHATRPGIVLIDPRFMTVPGGRAALEAAMAELPRWVLPMLVLDQPNDARTADLAEQVRDILSAAGVLSARSARRGARGVSSLRSFSVLVRDLVFGAEGQYISYRSRRLHDALPSPPSSGQSGRALPSPSSRFASAPDRLGETPDVR